MKELQEKLILQEDEVIDLDKKSIDITKEAEAIASKVEQKEDEEFEDFEGRVWSEIHNAYFDLLDSDAIEEIAHSLAIKFYRDGELNKGNPYDPEKLPDEGMSSEELKEEVDSLTLASDELEVPESETEVVDVPDIEDVNNGMYTIISQEMRDTLQDIENLKSIIVTLKAEDAEREAWAIEYLEAIIDERAIHVGMLQTILDSFDKGTKELIDQGVELTLEEPKDEDEKVLDTHIDELV